MTPDNICSVLIMVALGLVWVGYWTWDAWKEELLMTLTARMRGAYVRRLTRQIQESEALADRLNRMGYYVIAERLRDLAMNARSVRETIRAIPVNEPQRYE